MNTLKLARAVGLPLAVLICALSNPSNAQNIWQRSSYTLTFSAAAGNKEALLTLAIGHNIGLGQSQRFKMGGGIRFNSYFAGSQQYITAPAKFTSTQQNLGTIFSETIEANLDTVTIAKSQVNALNLYINLEYRLHPKWDIGFNIDAIGFSFGKKQSGTIQTSLPPVGGTYAVTAKPTRGNFLLTSDNDIGSLNSELFVRYHLAGNLALQGGVTFVFNEYTATTKPVLDNNRFRNKSLLPMIAISYNFKHKS